MRETVVDVDITRQYVEVQSPGIGVSVETRGSIKGDPGVDGRTLLYGDGVPGIVGTEGDFYIDRITWTIYGPKQNGVWPAGTLLKGVKGDPGAPGESGYWSLDPLDPTALVIGPSIPGDPGGAGDPNDIPYKYNVKKYGAKGDGVTNDYGAIQSAIDALPAGGVLYFPEGVYIVGTTLLLPKVAGCALKGPSIPTNSTLSGAVIQAKAGSNLPAILASPEWYNSQPLGSGPKDQAVTISNLSFYGGGFNDNQPSHDTQIETTSNCQNCVVVHGSNIKIQNCLFMSANQDGLVVAGNVGRDGATAISETHEMWIDLCGIRYTGRDGFHALGGAQDNYIGRTKVQYAGRHGFSQDNGASAWSFSHNHPSRCGSSMFDINAAWQCNLDHNYIDALGDFMDGVATPWRAAGAKRYGIRVAGGADNACHVDQNYMHTEASGGQLDPVVGLYLKGWVIATYNTLRYQTTDASVVMVEDGGLASYGVNIGNKAHMPGGG